MALAPGSLHAALLLVGAAVLVQHATAQSGTTAFGSFLTECGETKDPNTVVPNPLSCQVVHDIQSGDRHTYTVQVAPGSDFILLVQAKGWTVGGDVDLYLSGPVGSGINMYSTQRMGEQVLWLPAKTVLQFPGVYTITVEGYAYWSSYELTVQTQDPMMLAPADMPAIQAFEKLCDYSEPTTPVMCLMLQAAIKPDRKIEDDICSQPPNMCDAQGHLIKFVLMASDLGGNLQVKGLPTELGLLTRLQTLDLSMNYVLDTMTNLASIVGKLTNLKRLLLVQGRIQGTLECSLFRHPTLQTLYLSNGNLLSGSLPDCVFQSSTITELSLAGNNFQGSIPDFPAGSPLTLLDLSGSGISGDMVEALTGSIPSSIKNAKGLIYLDVANNQLTGTLPDMPVTLVTLSASNNHFSGQIPASVGASPNLRTLKLGNNQLLGTVPSGLIYAAPLETLNLSTNALSGSINFLWGNKGIKQFDVSNNRLTGEMPYLVSQQPSLRLLNLGGNKMSGDLSKFQYSGNMLTVFNVSGNALINCIPDSLKAMFFFSYVPPADSPSASTDPNAPPSRSILDLSGTGMNCTFPPWMLDGLGKLYNASNGDVSRMMVDLYGGGNTIMCPAASSASTLMMYFYKVQDAFDLTCQSAAGTNKTVTDALGYDQMVAAQSSGGGGSNTAAIAGAVIGVLAGVALLAGLGYWIYTKRQRRSGGSSSRKMPLTFNSAYDPSEPGAAHSESQSVAGSTADLFAGSAVTYSNPLASGASLTNRRVQ